MTMNVNPGLINHALLIRVGTPPIVIIWYFFIVPSQLNSLGVINPGLTLHHIWLVVSTYPSQKYEFVSWDDMTFPIRWEFHQIPWFQSPPTRQKNPNQIPITTIFNPYSLDKPDGKPRKIVQGAPSSKLPTGRGSVTVKLLANGRQAVTGNGSAMASARRWEKAGKIGIWSWR